MPPLPLHTSSISVHTLVPFTGAVLQELQGEDFLLIHECTRRGTSEQLRVSDADGNLVLDVEFNQTLLYAISASVLAFDGLANYFPGRALDDRLLAFANGRSAMQFRPGGKLIYRDPVQRMVAGDLPAIDFSVENIFVDLDTDTYPSTYTVLYQDLPAQSSVPLTDLGMQAALEGVLFAGLLDPGNTTSTLVDGAGSPSGTPTVSPIVGWNTFSEPVSAKTTLLSAPALVWAGTSAPRTIPRLTIERLGSPMADFNPLAPSQSLLPWVNLRADAADLGLTLHWPWDGANPSAADRPARHALRWLFGDLATAIDRTATTLTLRAWDADPSAAGAEFATLVITPPREALTSPFSVISPTQIQQDNSLTSGAGLALADSDVAYLTLEITGHAGVWFIKKAVSLTALTGNPLIIPAGTLDFTIG